MSPDAWRNWLAKAAAQQLKQQFELAQDNILCANVDKYSGRHRFVDN